MTIRGRITRVLLVAAVLAAANPVVPVRVLAADNPVVAENKMAGSNGWRLGSLVADDTAGQIKGYASATSVSQNAPITLYVSVNPAQTYSIDVYRVGWYGGMGGRLRLHVGGLEDQRAIDRNHVHSQLIDNAHGALRLLQPLLAFDDVQALTVGDE